MATLKALPGLLAALCMGAPALAAAKDVVPVVQPSGVDPEYRVNPGDELDILVWGDERLQRLVRVLPDGTLNFPLAGRVSAANRTVREIALQIRDNLAPNYREAPPDVTVAVRDATGMRFYVMGKVRTPGGFASGRSVNVLQALSMAGGLAEFADVKNAIILRQTAQGQTVEPVRLSRVLKGARKMDSGRLTVPLPVLGAGDVLVIP
ncbi:MULTISPECIES: polysaccharide biosynthesis/export family protein [unclassified Novosphingobium]|uniref:polysaccharide biosynthesis/export family protein n=1 Tax=unclassified Novosphingobium TaxID=2644732 RepID=UPI001F192E50|nr:MULTISPECIES: polysaccharide biosynthesis/export family protein [unclassified Novosphingobium]